MVQAADFPECDHLTFGDALYASGRWRVFRQREMSTRSVIVRNVAGQNAAQVLLAEYRHVVQAVAPDGTISLSAYGFCDGLDGADTISSIPMPATRWRNASP